MYKRDKKKIRIVAMLLCILLLSNFGLNITVATSDWEPGELTDFDSSIQTDTLEGRTGYLIFGGSPETKLDEKKMIATYEGVTEGEYFTITPSETAIYTISFSNGEGELLYTLRRDSADGPFTRLAAQYKNSSYIILTADTSENTTTIDVILEKNVTYYLKPEKISSKPVVITAFKQDIGKLSMTATNIPSNVVSNNSKYKDSTVLEQYQDSTIKTVEFEKSEIQEYIDLGVQNESADKQGGALEGILVDLVAAIGSMVMFVVESVIGVDTKGSLTIDGIIFNRFEDTVIDLTPLGGIQVGATGKGIFASSEVGNVISILYRALKALAFVIYIVMLLYIGVKILLSVGGKNQKKYFKYIEYWITGLFLLIFIPYFLPALPSLNNALIAMIGDESKSISSTYSVAEVLKKLGYDASYLGEDAEVVELHALIDEKINKLNEQIQNAESEATREEARAEIQGKIEEVMNDYSAEGGNKDSVQSKVEAVIAFIDANYDNWTEENEDEYEKLVGDATEALFDNSDAGKARIDVIKEQINRISPDILQNSSVKSAIDGALNYVKRNAIGWDGYYNDRVFNDHVSYGIQMAMSQSGLSPYYSEVSNCVWNGKTALIVLSRDAVFSSVGDLFTNYKDAVIQEAIGDLEEMKNSVNQDIMTTLKTKAQEEHRFVYILAWVILLFQMFAVLFMYYKRLFGMIILIILFPIIMAFYVFDKVQDGSSQSLKKWFDEFLANILVQLLHATIYVLLINVGIDICNANPDKNWLFLILTVCFLFPGERMLRSMLGLNSSFFGELKNSVGRTAVAAGAIYKTGKNLARGTKKVVSKEGRKEIKDNLKKELEADDKKREEKEKRKKRLVQRKNDSRTERQRRLKAGVGSVADKVIEGGTKIKEKVVPATINGAKAPGKVRTALRGAKKYGKFAVKKSWNVAKKGFGLGMGMIEGAESFGKEGLAGGIATARSVAHSTGGFKDQKPMVKKPNMQNKEILASQKYASAYKDGVKLEGKAKKASVGNQTPHELGESGKITLNKQDQHTKLKVEQKTNINKKP